MNRVLQLGIVVALLCMTAPPTVAADAVEIPGDIFVLDLTLMRNGTVNMSSVTIEEGQPTNFGEHDAQEPTHRLTMLSQDGEELYSQGLKIEFKVYPYGRDPYFIDERDFYWRLPYMQNASRVQLRDLEADDTVFTINLTDRFCAYDQQCPAFCAGKNVDADCTCGNDVCEEHENVELCRQDCGDRDPSGVRTREAADTGDDEGLGINTTALITLVITLIVIAALIRRAWNEVEIE